MTLIANPHLTDPNAHPQPGADLLRLLLAHLRTPSSDLNKLALYASGQTLGVGGSLWKGRRPRSGQLSDITSQLVQRDETGPALHRLVSAQLDRDPDWRGYDGATELIGTSDQRQAGEGETLLQTPIIDALATWHEDAALMPAVREAAYSREWAGLGLMRAYIPDSYRQTIEEKADWTLEQALELVHVQAVDPRDGGPLIDAHRRVLGYYYTYETQDPLTLVVTRYVELHTHESVQLFVRRANALTPAGPPMPNPMFDAEVYGSRRLEFLMFHVDRPGGSAITASAQDAQDRLNVAETYFGRNDDLFGFRMMVTTNAEQPVDDAGRPTTWKYGPDVVVSLTGIPKNDLELLDPTQPADRHTPTFQVIDPLDPAVFSLPSVNHWRASVLAAYDQEWIQDAARDVSGESKRQSRKGFDRRVVFAAADSARLLAWALRAALKLAASIVGPQAQVEVANIRFRPRMYLDVDSSNLAEYRELVNAWRDGALDLQTVLEATPGVRDSEQAAARVKAEWAERGGPPALGSTPAPTTGTLPKVLGGG